MREKVRENTSLGKIDEEHLSASVLSQKDCDLSLDDRRKIKCLFSSLMAHRVASRLEKTKMVCIDKFEDRGRKIRRYSSHHFENAQTGALGK